MSFDLQLGGLRAVVTGGTLGVGAAVVRQQGAAAAGLAFVVFSRRKTRLRAGKTLYCCICHLDPPPVASSSKIRLIASPPDMK